MELRLNLVAFKTQKTVAVFLWGTPLTSLLFVYLISRYRSWGYPMYSFLTTPNGRFDDFYVYLSYQSDQPFVVLENLRLLPGVFPVGAMMYRLLSPVSGVQPVWGLAIFLCLTFVLLWIGLTLTVSSRSVRVFAVLSFPVTFCFWRGNNEVLLLALFMITTHLLWAEEKTFLGSLLTAVSQMIEPNVIFLIFLKLWTRRSVTALLLAVLFTLLFLDMTTKSLNLLNYVRDVFLFTQLIGQPDQPVLMHNVSLFAGVLAWLDLFGLREIFMGSVPTSIIFGLVVPLGAIAVVLWTSIRSHNWTKSDRLIIASTLWVLSPTNSFIYREVWLLLPVMSLFELSRARQLSRRELLQVVVLCLCILPKSNFWFTTATDPLGFYEATLVDPILCLLLLSRTLFQRERSTFFDPTRSKRLFSDKDDTSKT